MAGKNLFAQFGDGPEWAKLKKWHDMLIDRDSDRGLQAELRRCRTPEQVCITRAFQRLWAALGSPGGAGGPDMELALPLALACGVLAHVKRPVAGAPFAALLGQAKPGQSEPRMTHQRLRRLLSIEGAEPDKLMAELIRAVRLAGDQAEVKSLAMAAMHWNDKTRRDWTFQYYGSSAATS